MVRRSWRTPLLWGNKELQMFINFTNEIMLIRDFVTEFISMIGLKMLENIEFSQKKCRIQNRKRLSQPKDDIR